MTDFSIQTEHRPGAALMKVQGRVDSETAPEFDQALSSALAQNNVIVINLQGVNFLSSAGLRAIVKAYQAVQKSGGDVRLSMVSQPVEVVLRTVGMMQMLKMFPSDQDALQNL